MITFKVPTEAEFQEFKEISITIYASELVKYQEYGTLEAARAYAVDEVESLVPQGVNTPNHYVYFLQDDQNKTVGYFWHVMEEHMEDNNPCSFLAYIYINEESRRRGYAAEAMRKYESMLIKEATATSIYFYVFRDNPAVLMYKGLGYETAESQDKAYLSTAKRYYMSKKLP